MTGSLATQRTQVNTSSRQMRDGREWLVAPVVALVPGVLNQELVLADEISRYTPAWDDSPITVYHPHDGESHVSARSIEMLDLYATGRLYNARFEDGRLKGEVWLDLERLAAFGDTGDAILRQIVDGTGCEVSTGYFRDVEQESGVLDGKRYVTIARNIRPDHLALLPAAEGACNWADGCGVPRTNIKESAMTKPVLSANQHIVRRALAALAEAVGIGDVIVPEESPESVPEVNDSGEVKATVSLIVSEELAAVLALTPGDLPAGSIIVEAPSLSVPLLTFEGGEDKSETMRYLSGELTGVARSTSIVLSPITGVGRLITGSEFDVLYLSIGGMSIQRWAYDLAEYLSYWAYSGEEDSAPCVEVLPSQLVLAYLPSDAPTPTITFETPHLVFSHLGVTCGEVQIAFPLAGELRPAPASPPEEAPEAETAEAQFATYQDLAEMLTLAKNSRGVVPASVEPEAETTTNGETPMPDRRQLIEALIASAACQCTRDALEAMSTDDLQVMADELLTPDEQNPGEVIPMPPAGLDGEPTPVAGNEDAPDAGEPEPDPEPVPAAETGDTVSNDAEPDDTSAPVPSPAELPAEITELLEAVRAFGGVSQVVEALRSMQSLTADARTGLIDSLTANSRCAFNAEQLAAFTTDQLTLLSQSLEPADFSAKPRPNGRTASTGSVVVEIPMPTL